MEGTVGIARASLITYHTHRSNGWRQKSFDFVIYMSYLVNHYSLNQVFLSKWKHQRVQR